jgi:hypothetical protein
MNSEWKASHSIAQDLLAEALRISRPKGFDIALSRACESSLKNCFDESDFIIVKRAIYLLQLGVEVKASI